MFGIGAGTFTRFSSWGLYSNVKNLFFWLLLNNLPVRGLTVTGFVMGTTPLGRYTVYCIVGLYQAIDGSPEGETA